MDNLIPTTNPQPPASAENLPSVSGGRHPSPTAGTERYAPRILVFTSEQRKLSSLSPFQRKDGCDRFGKILRCDRLRDGSIEVEFASAADASKAVKATSFTFSVREGGHKRDVSIPISVTPHKTKNTTKGIVNCFDLKDVENEDIVDGLAFYGVVEARRILSRRGGVSVPTNNIVLTFSGTELPSHITVGYVRVKVRTFIPNPMRCFRCQRFGHTRTSCRGKPTCSKCSSTDHIDDECGSHTLKCVNCGDDQTPHASYDRSCPAYAREKEINTIKATKNISFREARDLYNETHPKTSYAQKARVTQPVSATSLQQMTAAQLIDLLKSFGLSVVSAGSTFAAVPNMVAPPSSETVSLAPPSSNPEGGEAPVGPSETGDGDDWTLVQRRRSAGRRSSSPPQPAVAGQPSSAPTTDQPPRRDTPAMAALRRNEEEWRAREERRARLVERAREARLAEATSAPKSSAAAARSAGSSGAPTPPPTASVSAAVAPPPRRTPPPMGPPPPPPLPRRPGASPAPLSSASPSGEPPRTPQPSTRTVEPPSAPARPGKRSIAWTGSPSEGGTPRSRHRTHITQDGRASSADGRLLRSEAAHPRIHFGGDAPAEL